MNIPPLLRFRIFVPSLRNFVVPCRQVAFFLGSHAISLQFSIVKLMLRYQCRQNRSVSKISNSLPECVDSGLGPSRRSRFSGFQDAESPMIISDARIAKKAAESKAIIAIISRTQKQLFQAGLVNFLFG